MLIDFHIHAFHEKIAARAIESLEENIKVKSLTDGTLAGAKRLLRECGVDQALVLPIATKPSQQTLINDWAGSINGRDGIWALGSVHPAAPDALDELDRIRALGLRGVKLHPNFQDFFIDDKRAFPIYEKCAALGLFVVFHAGFDPLTPDTIYASPEGLLRIHRQFPKLTMVCAHLGGLALWDEVERTLVGEDVYLDTAVVARYIDRGQCERIIKNHGADRVLFGSDLPWSRPSMEYELVNSFDLTEPQKQSIFHGNAERLLGLSE